MEIVFWPHPYIKGMRIAKAGGYSVITGPFIDGYQVMVNGEVRTYNSLDRVERIIKEGLTR